MKRKIIFLSISIFIVSFIICFSTYEYFEHMKEDKINPTTKPITTSNYDFEYNLIHEINKENNSINYLISPLSIGYALSALNEGANGNTKIELENVLNNYTLNKNTNIKDIIGIANGVIINNSIKNNISQTFINNLILKYNSELSYDDFINTNTINNWVKEKTYGMIPSVIDSIDQSTMIAILNAIAIDIKWKNQFRCENTNSKDFTKIDNTITKAVMMHDNSDNDSNLSYIENNNAKGIIKDYAIYDKTTGQIVYDKTNNTMQLEYIAILPNTNITSYLNNFTYNELQSLISTKKNSSNNLTINLALPRYNYDYDFKNFMTTLQSLGIKDAFDENNANLSGMLSNNINANLYVSKAVHKTHIELNESGTKASAVTYLQIDENASIDEDKAKIINIEFNKPFIYIIKEKDSNNIWFIGAVYSTEEWTNKTITCTE